MALNMDKFLNAEISRRSFLKGSAAATAALAGISMAACGNESNLTPAPAATEAPAAETTAPVVEAAVADACEGGKWVAAPCWHNCGGKCLVKAYVKDGVIIRQGTDSNSSDDEVNRQQRACLRGFSQQYQARGLDRLKYPMKRKNWSPENPNPELRGIDEWERISWDEAATYIHDEIVKVQEKYGDYSILNMGTASTLLSKIGASYLNNWGTTSWGNWYCSPILGFAEGCNDSVVNNDRLDLCNCDYIFAFGYNPAWSALGNATNYAKMWADHGAKFVIFDPIYNDTCSILDAKWVPIRPGTDMAAMMAMSYVMLEEDDNGSLIDWDFLDRCCVGQDADHLPEDLKGNENYFDYLRGAYDNIPKTPEWAEEITGIPADTLRELARLLGKDNNVAVLSSWASARTYDTEQMPQTAINMAAMGGHIGKSGNCVGPTAWNFTNNFGPRLVKGGSSGGNGAVAVEGVTPGKTASVSHTQMWNAVMGEPFNPTGAFGAISGNGVKGWKDALANYDLTKRVDYIKANVHMIWTANQAKLTTAEGAKKGIEAMRAMDFCVGQSWFLTATNKYCDIVLPITTNWEREATGTQGSTNRDMLIVVNKVVEPFYEAKSDVEALAIIGEKFGLTPENFGLNCVPAKQQLFNAVKGSTVLQEDGKTWEPLCTITEDDIKEWGVEGEPQEGRIPVKQFIEEGIYRVDRSFGDNFGYIDKQAFREDPENNPIGTTSGKIEFACQAYADVLNSQGFDPSVKFTAIPKYRAPRQGYEETFVDGKIGGEKTEFPLQCINPHYQRRSHSIFDNVPWLREAMPNPVYLSKKDAADRGIKEGDVVKISSKYGETLRKAYITGRMMPGVVGLLHGPWVKVDEATGIDTAGSENYITGEVASGLGCNGYNTLNVEVSKYEYDLPEDVDVPQTILFD